MERFTNIIGIPPIDFWEHAIVASQEETDRVLAQMPEEPEEKLPEELAAARSFIICCRVTRIATTLYSSSGR